MGNYDGSRRGGKVELWDCGWSRVGGSMGLAPSPYPYL